MTWLILYIIGSLIFLFGFLFGTAVKGATIIEDQHEEEMD